ncbi:hypothetical protein CerSpe_019580 [Prunus speciosa]
MVTTRRQAASATSDPKTPQNATNPNPNTRNPRTPFSTTAIISASVKSVLLHDWWLVKAKGKGLAVGGLSSRDGLGVRVFSSAEISKRHTATVLETADGIMVTVTGFLDRSRTHQNGFPPELYNHFLLGFPFNWEEYAAVDLGEDSTDIGASLRKSASQKFNMPSRNNESNSLPFSLDDLSATKGRDILMLSYGDSDYHSLVKNIFSDILGTSKDNAFEHTGSSINLNAENSCPVENVDSGTTKTPTKHKKVIVQDGKNMITETSRVGVSTRSMTKGVSTRSMTIRKISTRSITRRKL